MQQCVSALFAACTGRGLQFFAAVMRAHCVGVICTAQQCTMLNLLRVLGRTKQPDETGIFSPRVQAYVQPSGALIFAANSVSQTTAGDKKHTRPRRLLCRRFTTSKRQTATSSSSYATPHNYHFCYVAKETPASARFCHRLVQPAAT